ncbi:MAG: hypothetical protein ACR2IE_12000 [Candidatus Sumerlaeaceae bacterium]
MKIAEVQANSCVSAEKNLEIYQAPQVELVLTPEALVREVHYAGVIVSCPGINCPPG